MREEFKPWGKKLWGVSDEGVILDKSLIPYSEQPYIKIVSAPSIFTCGVGYITFGDITEAISWENKDRERAAQAIAFANQHSDAMYNSDGKKYSITSHTGTTLEVYEEYIILDYVPVASAIANILKGGGNGGKRIDIADITAIQFKEPGGVSVGFIQFTFPGSGENKKGIVAAIDDENSILISLQNLAIAREAVDYIEKRRKELRSPQATIIQQTSTADELKKFKELLDMGAITQEEFDAKKKQLLGL